MRLAIISDTHFGDRASMLANWEDDSKSKAIVNPDYYEKFKRGAGTGNDYLVLLGDIFDISISSYEDTYRVGKAFFERVQKDGIARNIIYVPGNHDGDMWHFYEHQVNVINRVSDGRPPRNFRFSVPGIIDGRKGARGSRFTLLGVTKKEEDPEFGYGGLFLDNITVNDTKGGGKTGVPLKFAFAYPNLYLITDRASVLLTHGHYFELYWSLLSEWIPKIARQDLHIGDTLDLAEMVALNFPLNQLACSGVGQAGPLSEIVQRVQRQVKDKQLDNVKRYVENLDNEVDKLTPARKVIQEAASDAASNYAKKKIIEALEKSDYARDDDEFIHKPEVLERFKRFLDCSLLEINEINRKGDIPVPSPNYVIFGHTHDPIRWNRPNPPKTTSSNGEKIEFYNTGGWLKRKNKKTGEDEFCGAEIFRFNSEVDDPEKMIDSYSIPRGPIS